MPQPTQGLCWTQFVLSNLDADSRRTCARTTPIRHHSTRDPHSKVEEWNTKPDENAHDWLNGAYNGDNPTDLDKIGEVSGCKRTKT